MEITLKLGDGSRVLKMSKCGDNDYVVLIQTIGPCGVDEKVAVLGRQRWNTLHSLQHEITEKFQAVIAGCVDIKYQQPLGGGWFVSVTSTYKFVDVRQFFSDPKSVVKFKPTRRGVTLRANEWSDLCTFMRTMMYPLQNANGVDSGEDTTLQHQEQQYPAICYDDVKDILIIGHKCTSCGVTSPGSTICIGCYHQKQCGECQLPPATYFGEFLSCKSSYILTPPYISHKACVINIKNYDDNKCFLWSVLAALDSSTHYGADLNYYTKKQHLVETKDLTFPLQIEDVYKFEMMNSTISINVLSMNGRDAYLEYRSPFLERQNHINLMLLRDVDNKGHYIWIKNLSRLLAHRTTKHHHSFICNGCLHPFTSEIRLAEHKPSCYSLATTLVFPPTAQ